LESGSFLGHSALLKHLVPADSFLRFNERLVCHRILIVIKRDTMW
jgi:hypothetical protein